MSKLRRYGGTNGVCFLTCVTYRRVNILIENIDLLLTSYKSLRRATPFDLIAYVILPDHFHCVIDSAGDEFTNIIQRLKMSFGMHYRKRMGMRSGRVWQHRFWDHIIRDQEDMNRHADYIHYNPVKHGYSDSPRGWRYSSIHKASYRGVYPEDWGSVEPSAIAMEVGE